MSKRKLMTLTRQYVAKAVMQYLAVIPIYTPRVLFIELDGKKSKTRTCLGGSMGSGSAMLGRGAAGILASVCSCVLC